MNQQQFLKQTLETKLVISQMLRQAIDLLQLSNLELVQKIEQEMNENPLIEEVSQKPQDISLEEAQEKLDNKKNNEISEDDLMVWQEHFQDDFRHNDYEIKEQTNYEEFTTRRPSLNEHLLWQLSTAKLSYHESKIGELLIGYFNPTGYFIGQIDEIAQNLNISINEVERVLKIIQKFDPIGIGARNLKECLLIQAEEMYPKEKLLYKIIKNYFEDVADKRFDKISDGLEISLSEVQKYFEIIKSLEPKPGRQFHVEPINYITPDVIIEKIDDDYVVIINDLYLPAIRINHQYKEILQKNSDKEVKKYLKQKLESASWLLNSIDQRKSTLYKTTLKIVEHQKDFLDKGILFLKPLNLRDIAQAIEMHESTVSRITTNKYAQTPLGIFELKYFFARRIENNLGEDLSTLKVKDKIKLIVEAENKDKPISDKKIAELLQKEGLNIARRTVAKYREEIDIPSSAKRKKI